MPPSSLSSLFLLILLSPLLSTAFTYTDEDPLIQEVVSRDNNNHDDLLSNAENQFMDFKTKYHKNYPTQEEDDYRFGVFISNLRLAKRHQKLDPTAVHGVTKFSDLTPSEFRRGFSSSSSSSEIDLMSSEECKPAQNLSLKGLPTSFNWPKVTQPRDQMNCNSCWAFSTIAVLEGAHYRVNHELVNLSEQQLLDCSRQTCKMNDPKICNIGCGGGFRVLGFKHVKEIGGVVKREEYPYIDKNDTCHIKNEFTASIDDFFCIPEEAQYKPHLVEFGPIAVNIKINLLNDYINGVICKKSKNDTMHAVTLVGYSDDDEYESGKKSHWIVKNSWGSNWGEGGFFRVCRGIIEEDLMGIYAIAAKKKKTSAGSALKCEAS